MREVLGILLSDTDPPDEAAEELEVGGEFVLACPQLVAPPSWPEGFKKKLDRPSLVRQCGLV
ncbi:hypothetical protein WMF37_40405 [Sorangium sp. So ce291]|uniref:hypothetical protein n=1 Tax=Sorangium sp. So ce291 TaxID=3133294 RepID=UPI003F5E715F